MFAIPLSFSRFAQPTRSDSIVRACLRCSLAYEHAVWLSRALQRLNGDNLSYLLILNNNSVCFRLHETVEWYQYLGFAFLALSMFLLRKKDAELRFEKGWGICVTVTFICNGLCSVTQKLHQVAYPGEYCREFSLVASFFMTAVLLLVSLIKREKASKESIKFALPAGALMGLANFLSLVLSSKIDATVLFPMITIFTIILNWLVSKLFFKDKFSLAQIFGIILGAVSVILIK